MWAILLLLTGCFQVQGCDDDKNYGTISMNPDCGDRGSCFRGSCRCCNSVTSTRCSNEGIMGHYVGDSCENVRYYISEQFGFLIPNGTCSNDDVSLGLPTLENVQTYFLPEYNGSFQSVPCEVCTADDPCSEFEEYGRSDKTAATEGVLIKFETFFNSHYDPSCPTTEIDYLCDKNYDDGITAMKLVKDILESEDILKNVSVALGYAYDVVQRMYFKEVYSDDSGSTRTRRPTAKPTQPPTHSPTPAPTEAPTASPTPLPTLPPTQSPTTLPTEAPTSSPTPLPTQVPTQVPTSTPTPLPTQVPTQVPTQSPTQSPTKVLQKAPQCILYGNEVKDFRLVDFGVGSSCRGNISESWPGGRSCESPYIICLPQENTPAYFNYRNNTHRYSVLECQQECSLDQRCRGFEFVADTNSSLGDCNLIDDIEVRVVNESMSRDFVYNENDKITNLDSTVTGGDAICFEKLPGSCNPYFEIEDLNQTMLDCYCPNDRKGSYTKKVKRTVENTRYCGDDASMDERIKLAHANRMFHLCENWCLFNTLNPEQESWYWDPWNTCWYETYSGMGAHRAYCDRVIRNPNSIELQFVNRRAENFISCSNTKIPPTESPVEDVNITYYLSDPAGSCDEACSGNGMTCAADQTARVFSSETDLMAAFKEAGFTCQSDNIIMNRTNWEGWALPGLGYGRICANRQPTLTLSHLEDLDSDCNRKIGKGWNRLCACY